MFTILALYIKKYSVTLAINATMSTKTFSKTGKNPVFIVFHISYQMSLIDILFWKLLVDFFANEW